jgi:hypothetical protein
MWRKKKFAFTYRESNLGSFVLRACNVVTIVTELPLQRRNWQVSGKSLSVHPAGETEADGDREPEGKET